MQDQPRGTDPADRLDPVVLHHIVNTLGWPDLRPLQKAAISPLMDGEDAILLAPTAAWEDRSRHLPPALRHAGRALDRHLGALPGPAQSTLEQPGASG